MYNLPFYSKAYLWHNALTLYHSLSLFVTQYLYAGNLTLKGGETTATLGNDVTESAISNKMYSNGGTKIKDNAKSDLILENGSKLSKDGESEHEDVFSENRCKEKSALLKIIQHKSQG